jgi:glyoxylase-like metal-dependent hydrolase (beta-lactamase superfamily II)
VAPDPYAVPASLKKDHDTAAGAFGIRSAQWLLTFGYVALPFFYDFQTAPVAPVPVELAKGVKLVIGASHNVLAIEMADHVVAVDAPLYDEYTKAVLAQIKAAFPGKPLERVIATHFHHDHSGGIREFAAEGNVTVNVGKPSVDFFKQVFTHAHTVDPDRLQASKAPVVVEPVDSLMTIPAPGGNEIQLHRISNGHAEDLLIVYLKNEKMVFQADLWATPPTMPAVGSGGLFAKQLYEAITKLKLDVTTIVSAHSGSDGSDFAYSAPIAYLKVAAGL